VIKIAREIGIIQLEYVQISDTEKEKGVKCKVVYTTSGEEKEYYVVIDKLIAGKRTPFIQLFLPSSFEP